jgi:hypothetical protein
MIARVRVIVGLAAFLVAALLADHFGFGGVAAGRALVPTPAIPSLSPTGALASTWFCPALGATSDSPVRGRIIIADPGPTDLHVTSTFVPSTGPAIVQDAVVPAYTRMTYKLEEQAPSPFTATTVSIDGSAGAVEQEIQGPAGQSISPCATSSSSSWYFASGRTDTNAATLLSLYNPFLVGAIADLSFATDQGPSVPDAYQGLVIPPQTDLVLNLGDRVRLRTSIATTVAVRSGRLIADKLEIQNGSSGAPQGSTPFKGLSLTLGDTAPGQTWYFADGVKAPGVTEHFDIYNPNNSEASVQVASVLEGGSAQPFGLTVPPDDRIILQVDQESRIPPSVGEAWVVSSALPVVVERMYEEMPPAPRTGVADSMGSPRLSPHWVFAAGSASNGGDEYLIVFNPGVSSAQVTVTVSGAGTPMRLPTILLPPGQRHAVRIGDSDKVGIAVLDVASTVPIVAARAQGNVGQPGLSGTVGIPDR